MTKHHHQHAAAQDLQSFPLIEALLGRRSRRFGVGMALPDGPLAYTSPPRPLSELERTLLVLAGSGARALNPGTPCPQAGTPDAVRNDPVRSIGHLFPGASATFGSELLITDDTGSYITRLRNGASEAIQGCREPGDLFALVERLRPSIVRIDDALVELQCDWPHGDAHDRRIANQPGAALFVPVGDQVDSLFNRLWIAFGEGVPVSDDEGRLLGRPAELIAAGALQPERAQPLSVLEASCRASLVSALTVTASNIQLTLQAMGLGDWLFSGIHPQSLPGAFADEGLAGFGFRFEPGPRGPDPVGLDGHFEPLVPPYVPDLETAAWRFAERKFGPQGVFRPKQPGPHRDEYAVKSQADRYPERFVAYLGSVAQDAHDRFGRFPVTVPSVAVAGYAQGRRVGLDHSDRFYREALDLETHARHRGIRHGGVANAEPAR